MRRFSQLRSRGGASVTFSRSSCPHLRRAPAFSTRRQQSTAAVTVEEGYEPSKDKFYVTPTHHTALAAREKFAHLPSPPPQSASSSAKLAALHARLNLSPRLPLETLARCLIDPSADPHPSFNNQSLSVLGSDLLGYHTSELILCTYPRLPTVVIFATMEAYCGFDTLGHLVREWGVEYAAAPGGEVDPGLLQYKLADPGNADPDHTGIMNKELPQETPKEKRSWGGEWNRGLTAYTVSGNYFGEAIDYTRVPTDYISNPALLVQDTRDKYARGITQKAASTRFARALFGAVHLHAGRAAAKAFFNAHIGSRKLDVASMFRFKQPTRDLSRLCAREGLESPVARILSETGRKSRTPVFVVGVFSGREKLGEGTGASLEEARFRAAANALKGWYLYSPLDRRVPSDVEGGGGSWKPVMVDGGEVIV